MGTHRNSSLSLKPEKKEGEATLLFLGTGGSLGVPVVSCRCSVCTSSSMFNKRYRPSVLLSVGGQKIIIDIGPDFRDQMLKYDIRTLSGALLTHAHYDHIGGFDEVRIFYLMHKMSFPILASLETYKELQGRFDYFFKPHISSREESKPIISMQLLEKEKGKVSFQGLSFHYFSYVQQGMKITGFRFGSLAYVSDIFEYGKEVIEALKGIDILVVSALRHSTSPAHFTVEEAIAFSRLVGAKKTFLTHIAHDLDHHELSQSLPEDIRLAYDGLELRFLFR